MKRRKPIRRRNEERAAKLRAEQFGPQADRCRSLPCCVCGARPPSVPHHARSRGAGGKDKDTVPLCWRCHHVIHARGEKALIVDLSAVARKMAKEMDNG